MKDAFGTEIEVDSTVVYATRRGSSMNLNKLKVTSVSDDAVQGYNPGDISTRRKTLKQSLTIVVVPQLETPDADV